MKMKPIFQLYLLTFATQVSCQGSENSNTKSKAQNSPPDRSEAARAGLAAMRKGGELQRVYRNTLPAESSSMAWTFPSANTCSKSWGEFGRVQTQLERENKEQGGHEGTDIPPAGSKSGPIFAAADGTVIYVLKVCAIAKNDFDKNCGSSWGNHVIIDHGQNIFTRYAHLSSVSVSVGEKIKAAKEIGRMGTTGRSMGEHLHFELGVSELGIDPSGAPQPFASGRVNGVFLYERGSGVYDPRLLPFGKAKKSNPQGGNTNSPAEKKPNPLNPEDSISLDDSEEFCPPAFEGDESAETDWFR